MVSRCIVLLTSLCGMPLRRVRQFCEVCDRVLRWRPCLCAGCFVITCRSLTVHVKTLLMCMRVMCMLRACSFTSLLVVRCADRVNWHIQNISLKEKKNIQCFTTMFHHSVSTQWFITMVHHTVSSHCFITLFHHTAVFRKLLRFC